jgi:hypothetical protein
MSITTPDPGKSADSITPPWPIRLAQQLETVSVELGQLSPTEPQAAHAKADVDRAIARLKSLSPEG